ncbi:MAG TPA: hypothetical protein PLH84_12275 [Candidatus Krumholzibacteria bacterium]|nr:hypothetical protein [Candidatus Krumholzibacteria bacterium]
MSGLSGYHGHLFQNRSRWDSFSPDQYRFALLHAPRGLGRNPSSQRKFADLYGLFAARCATEDRLAFLTALDRKEQGAWGEPERLWTVVVEDPDLDVVREAARLLAARLGPEAVRTRAYKLRAANPERSRAVLEGARRAPPGA